MPVPLYMDHNVPWAITEGLRLRGVDVLTAHEDGARELEDPVLLDRAGELGRLLFSMDQDLLAEATRRQRAGLPFAGVAYAHQRRCPIGRAVEDLQLVSEGMTLEEVAGRLVYIPL